MGQSECVCLRAAVRERDWVWCARARACGSECVRARVRVCLSVSVFVSCGWLCFVVAGVGGVCPAAGDKIISL